jgi:uncharacterized protein (DUF885 family)
MKRFKRILLSLVLLLSFVTTAITLTSCDNNNSNNDDETVEITKDDLRALEFEDLTVDYDGQEHSILLKDLPEGVEVTYTNNGQKLPGVYTIVAKLKYGKISLNKTAKLTINAVESVLTAPAEQTIYLYQFNLDLQYELNNDEQYIEKTITQNGVKLSEADMRKEGTYTVDIYAPKLYGYGDSNHVTVTVHVVNSKFDIKFENAEFEADGTEKKIEISGTLPAGYTVVYENNKGTEAGNYYALAKICDASGQVVETHAATLSIKTPENALFAEFLDEFFVAYLEGDQLSVNIFCENPADFGLEHYDATWYTYETYTDEDLAEAKQQFVDLLAELEEFKDAKLDSKQQIAYNNIYKFLNYYTDFYNIKDATLMKVLYVDSFGGYVADFGTYMEAYSLRGVQEVEDVISYINSTKTAFPSYLTFVKDKADAGYPLSDYTIDEMRNYLKEIIDSNDYYLKDILHTKIDSLSFLDDAQKTDYKNQVTSAITNSFMPAIKELYDGLEQYKGKLTKENEGYWSKYEHGKEMYLLELEDLLGLDDFDTTKYIKDVETAFSQANSLVMSSQQAIVKEFNISTYAELEEIVGQYKIYDGTPEEMMEYLKEFAKTIVPELQSEPDINIKEMDGASAKVSNAVAYYMKSALDNKAGENITLNPLKLGDSNDVLGTLAHEGYPGHLYAYVYSKEQGLSNLSTIMTSTAHGEGWATYVELKLYQYAKSKSTDEKFNMVMDYLYANQMSGFLLETRIDAGIHIEGWTVEDVASFLSKRGYNADSAQDIFNLLIEMPSGYAAYGYGKLFFNKLHTEAKNILGAVYDEVEFNAMLLSNGWTSLGELQKTYNEYMKAKCHQYGIAFE